MSAQCSICFEKFGFFRRSLTCQKCRACVCKHCTKKNICLKCLIPDIQPRNDFVEPPKNLYDNNLSRVALSRVEKEKNISDITEQMKVLPPPNLADESSQSQSEYENSKKLELEIENRLADLRNDGPITKVRKPIVRVMSISREDEDEETAVKRIIDQTVNEVELDRKRSRLTSDAQDKTSDQAETSDLDKEIEERLNQLKSVPIGGTGKTHKWSWQIEEEKRQKEEDEEMEKWCVICNNNGHVRCLDCDGDAYCKRCFREQHGRNNLDEHETEPIKK